MGRKSRAKGVRTEHQVVAWHQDAGIPAEKVSRSGYGGEDLHIGDLKAEVKARANGNGFSTLEKWLGNNDVLFLKRDRQKPMVCLSWSTWIRLVKVAFRYDP